MVYCVLERICLCGVECVLPSNRLRVCLVLGTTNCSAVAPIMQHFSPILPELCIHRSSFFFLLFFFLSWNEKITVLRKCIECNVEFTSSVHESFPFSLYFPLYQRSSQSNFHISRISTISYQFYTWPVFYRPSLALTSNFGTWRIRFSLIAEIHLQRQSSKTACTCTLNSDIRHKHLAVLCSWGGETKKGPRHGGGGLI